MDESSAYLEYLNDPAPNFLNTSGETSLNDAFPFSEIETNDWQSETLPVLINPNSDIEFFNINSNVIDNTIVVTETENEIVQTEDLNYTPVIENCTNNNAVIQLLNSDGSSVTVDKQKFEENKEKKSYELYYTPIIAFKCKICAFLGDSDVKIRKHLDEKHSSLFQDQITQIPSGQSLLKVNQNKQLTIYLCGVCKIGFPNSDKLNEHILTNHSETEQKIEDPSENKTKNLKVLSNFLLKQQEKARRKIPCTVDGCHVRLPCEEQRKKHENCHVDDNKSKFKCTVCNEKFSIWRICSNHLWKCHRIDVGMLNCPMCNKFKSNSPAKVMNHMALHDDQRPFLCSECGKSYKSMVQLRNHEVSHRKDKNLPNWVTMKWCEICERFFASSKSLKIHIRSVHENFKPFVCTICGHKTTRKAMLEIHIRQHTGAKPHKCPYCDYRTGDHNCLRKHMMKHIGHYNYSCPHCNYKAIQSSNFKNHLRNRHPGKSGTYSCTSCTYTSINFANFCAHVKRHEAETKSNGNRQSEDSIEPMLNGDNNDDDDENIFGSEAAVAEETLDTGGVTIPAENHLIAN